MSKPDPAVYRNAWMPSTILARVLMRSKEDWAVLTGAHSEFEIPATSGTSTRDRRWSLLDAVRMGAVAAFADLVLTTPELRLALFNAIGWEEVAVAVAPLAEEPDGLFLVYRLSAQGKPIVESFRGLDGGSVKVTGVVVNLRAIALFVAKGIQTLSKEEALRPHVPRTDAPKSWSVPLSVAIEKFHSEQAV